LTTDRENTLSFVTPDAWLVDRGVRRKYEGLVFSRSERGEDVIGVGHRAFDQGIRQALESPVSMAAIRELPRPTIVFQIFDQVTEHAGALQTSAVAITVDVAAKQCRLLRDLELLEFLNRLSLGRSEPQATPAEVGQAFELAESNLLSRLHELHLPFVAPAAWAQLVLWPG
jgi:hypothetical protein